MDGVEGRLVYVFAQDFTVFGGSLSAKPTPRKICKIMDLAMKMGAPVIGLNDSGGARIQEGVMSLAGTQTFFCATQWLSRRDSTDFGDHGSLRGRGGLLPGDHRFHGDGGQNQSYMFVTGPDVIKTVTHEEVTKEELGGAMTHNETSAALRIFWRTMTKSACLMLRELLRFIPSNNVDEPPRRCAQRSLRTAPKRLDNGSRRIERTLRHQGCDSRRR